MSDLVCSSCNSEIKENWKYCRYCGAAQTVIKSQDETDVDLSEPEKEIQEIKFDKELYYNVLSTRTKRSQLINKKKELLKLIDLLIEQLEEKIITREYALPKIKELKQNISNITTEEKKYKNLPTDLPVEILLDEIDAALNRIEKIEKLKADKTISKEGLREAKAKAQSAYNLLRDQYSKISGHLRNWRDEIKIELDRNRKQIEQLYIRFKTGELTEAAYSERKDKLAEEIETQENVLKMVDNMI